MAPLALHRDTWATNLYAQINWWTPVFPVESSRTMNLYPDLWAKPVPKDSEIFDLPRTMARGGEKMVAMRASDAVTPATYEVDTRSSLPAVLATEEVCYFPRHHPPARVVTHRVIT